jgi:hypothetical protein
VQNKINRNAKGHPGLVRNAESDAKRMTFLDIQVGQSFQDILVGMGMQKSDTKHTPFAETKDCPGHSGWSALPGHSG